MSDGEDILGGRVPASGLVGAKLLPGSIVTSASTFHVELHKVRFRKPFWELRLSELTGVYQVHDATFVSERKREREKARHLRDEPAWTSERKDCARIRARSRPSFSCARGGRVFLDVI